MIHSAELLHAPRMRAAAIVALATLSIPSSAHAEEAPILDSSRAEHELVMDIQNDPDFQQGTIPYVFGECAVGIDALKYCLKTKAQAKAEQEIEQQKVQEYLAKVAADEATRKQQEIAAEQQRQQQAQKARLASAVVAAPIGSSAGVGEPPDSEFDRLAGCESGGRWNLASGNGFYGGLQFMASTWTGLGGSGLPSDHPRETQIEIARRQWRRSGWTAWPSCSRTLGLR
jgi:hypothetical protein